MLQLRVTMKWIIFMSSLMFWHHAPVNKTFQNSATYASYDLLFTSNIVLKEKNVMKAWDILKRGPFMGQIWRLHFGSIEARIFRKAQPISVLSSYLQLTL